MFVIVCFRVNITIMPMKTIEMPTVAPKKNRLELKRLSGDRRFEKAR